MLLSCKFHSLNTKPFTIFLKPPFIHFISLSVDLLFYFLNTFFLKLIFNYFKFCICMYISEILHLKKNTRLFKSQKNELFITIRIRNGRYINLLPWYLQYTQRTKEILIYRLLISWPYIKFYEHLIKSEIPRFWFPLYL